MADIKVYSTQTCPCCVMAGGFLKRIGINFREFYVSGDQERAREGVEKSGQMGVPVVEINGKMMIGFDPSRIIEVLGGGVAG